MYFQTWRVHVHYFVVHVLWFLNNFHASNPICLWALNREKIWDGLSNLCDWGVISIYDYSLQYVCHSQISKMIFNIEMVQRHTTFLFSYSSDILLFDWLAFISYMRCWHQICKTSWSCIESLHTIFTRSIIYVQIANVNARCR